MGGLGNNIKYYIIILLEQEIKLYGNTINYFKTMPAVDNKQKVRNFSNGFIYYKMKIKRLPMLETAINIYRNCSFK